ncbi:MAG: phosphotransferase [Acidobacteria bacterium]|nr:phosphotransferase [Acidobacteriota bacterium]
MNIPTELRTAHPDVYWLAEDDHAGLTNYLLDWQWLAANEAIHTVTKAGEGNMNCTLRVTTNERSFIVKQARPWVEKYPTIAAPWERALIEGGFYQLIAGAATLQQMMPRLLGSDAVSRINVFEDLGASDDLMRLYAGERKLELAQIETLAAYLTQLHRGFVRYEDKAAFANRAMRTLNHFHIFVFPLQPANGFDLDAITPGLQAAAQKLKDNAAYVARVTQLGELYLQDGDALLHGDFFPGSWLQAADGLKVIDPEFCFFGAAEFELGVMLAHLLMTGHSQVVIDRLWQSYQPASSNWQPALVEQFAGIEIMRRLIGVAQLPLRLGLAEKTVLLEHSVAIVMHDKENE